MAQFAPDILFTNPHMASQLVRLADLDAAQKHRQQTIALASLEANANRNAHEREANQRNALQYQALLNQNAQHNSEMAARERMLQSQLGSQKDLLNAQLDAQRELARLNPWGKGGVDAYLGTAQINSAADQANKEGDAEAAQLNAQLSILDQEHASRKLQHNPNWLSRLGRGIGGGIGLMDTNSEADQNFDIENTAQRNQKLTALMGLAKKSYYDPARHMFVAIKRSGISMPGTPGQPTEVPTTPPDSGGGTGGGGLGYQAPTTNLDFSIPGQSPGGYIPSRFAPVPWLDNPNQNNLRTGGDSIQQIESDYTSGTIDAPTAISRRQALGL